MSVASRAGVEGAAKGSAYSASKNGVIGLTRCAAKDMGSRGIRVNAVAPYTSLGHVRIFLFCKVTDLSQGTH